MSFNGNMDGIAPNNPCVSTCPNRSAYCHGNCAKYKEWQLIQKKYSNKVRWIRKKMGYGVRFNDTHAYTKRGKNW